MKVTALSDYLRSQRVSASGTEAIDLPKSNVLLYDLEGGAWFAVRPSGTEPKLKIYMGVKGTSAADSGAKISALKAEADRLVGQV